MRAKQFVPIVEAQQELFEVNMSPGSLKKLASGIDALVGIEFEMIVPDVGSMDDDDREPEEDMDYDQEADDIEDITRFFDGDYNDRSTIRDLQEELRGKFYEWQSEQIDEQWNNDGRKYFAQWVKDNVDPDTIADHVDKEEDLFGNRNPDGSDWTQFIEDEWEEGFDSDSYQWAYDDFLEEGQVSCGVCYEDYSSSSPKLIPRRLECGHVACTSCLEGAWSNDAIICPECCSSSLCDSV
jgi:hypothetical protein